MKCSLGTIANLDSTCDEIVGRRGKIAKVVAIEFAEEGKMLEGKPPYYGGFLNPPGHRRAGKTMGPREVTLEAPWFDRGVYITDAGGNGCWKQVYINPTS